MAGKEVVSRAELDGMRSSINSYLGLLKHYRAYHLKQKVFSRTGRLFEYGYLSNSMNIYYFNNGTANQTVALDADPFFSPLKNR